MNWLKVFVLSYIRGYRVIERNNRFITQKLTIEMPSGIRWKGLTEHGELYSRPHKMDYCAVDTFDEAVARYYKYLDYIRKQRKANKTYVHALPPKEPEAWRILKTKIGDAEE